MEAFFEESPISDTCTRLSHVVNTPDSPGMHRRIQMGELPFVSGNLPAGMLELLEQHQKQLFFCELRVDQCERYGVKRQVPCGKPRVFPFVWHGQHAHGIEVPPMPVSNQ